MVKRRMEKSCCGWWQVIGAIMPPKTPSYLLNGASVYKRGAGTFLRTVRCLISPDRAKRSAMHTSLNVGIVMVALSIAPFVAEAGKVEGVGIGAGVGAVIAGPAGAVVGGVVGYNVGGPNIITGKRYRSCWRDDRGRRHCARR